MRLLKFFLFIVLILNLLFIPASLVDKNNFGDYVRQTKVSPT